MDRATVDIYEAEAATWEARRSPGRQAEADAFARRSRPPGPVLDLGCGPGWYAARFPPPVVALDAAGAMVRRAVTVAGAHGVQADLAALPFRRGALAAAWANHSYVHLPREAMPLALADLHRSLQVGAPAMVSVFAGDDQGRHVFPGDDFPGRYFSQWAADRLGDVVEGAGFKLLAMTGPEPGGSSIQVDLVRARRLADTVGPGMRVLLVGLNPSLYAADAGVGFARPGNRFWPAALAAGLVSRDRNPRLALIEHGVGMTDLVKRATVAAAELGGDELRAGAGRVERLVAWLQPGVVCVLGLGGWRTVSGDRRAAPGVQPEPFGGRPVYVMPNPSGLNAQATVDVLAGHLAAAAAVADAGQEGAATTALGGTSTRSSGA